MSRPAQAPVVQALPGAGLCFADKSRCSTCLCSVGTSRSSKGSCYAATSRCSSGPCGVDTSRSNTSSCCPGKSKCSSGSCGVDTSRCSLGFFVYTVKFCQQIFYCIFNVRGGNTDIRVRNCTAFREISPSKCRGIPCIASKIPYSSGSQKPFLWTPYLGVLSIFAPANGKRW
jgi:hypothetical protein